MNLAELWAELEAEKLWRDEEIRFLQNQAAKLNDQADQLRMRRALIVLLYAHFEGYCKFAFSLYVGAINKENIKCGEADYAIAAATLSDLFQSLREPSRKSKLFQNTLPEDRKLHQFALDREFLERINEFTKRPVKIPDVVIDMESNLTPYILQKVLFRLGLNHTQFDDLQGNIMLLLEHRHRVAHGATMRITEEHYISMRDAVYLIIDRVARDVMSALEQKHYLRSA